MEFKDIKTMDLNALEWFDRINGNSYFSCEIVLNYGLENYKKIVLPFQYGYGDQYEFQAMKEIIKVFDLKFKEASIYRLCKENEIILRSNKEENCLKKDLLTN